MHVHDRIDAEVVRYRCQDHMAKAECLGDQCRYMRIAYVIYDYIRNSTLAELSGKSLSGGFCVAVHCSVGDHYALLFRLMPQINCGGLIQSSHLSHE